MGTDKVLDRAILMADKDGHKWVQLNDIMQRAYIHNAETAIATEAVKPPVIDDKGKEVPTCYLCKGEEWLTKDGVTKPCPECNPMGLHQVFCGGSENKPGEVPPPAPGPETDTGTEAPEIKQPPADLKLNKGFYWCGLCGSSHNEEKKTGKKHLKYKIEIS